MILQRTKTYIQNVYQATPRFLTEAGVYIDLLGTFESFGGFHFEQMAGSSSVHAVHSGEGRICCDGQVWTARKGDLFILRKGKFYEYWDIPAAPWKYTFFRLNGPAAEQCLNQIGLTADQPVLCPTPQNFFWVQLNRLQTAFEQGTINGIASILAGWEMLECLDGFSNIPANAEPLDPSAAARNLIDGSPACITNVDSLVQGLQTNRTSLFRCFKKRYGLSVKQYIEQVRFERIETLLRNPSVPLSQIARLGGFDDPLYFSRAFKKRHGISPSQMRTRIQV